MQDDRTAVQGLMTDSTIDSYVGKELPQMTLESSAGGHVKIPENLLGKWTLIYFYPKDDTPGCTKQACSYRDSMADFKKLGVQVYGVSTDDLHSHDAFIKKFNLNFPLLADTNHTLGEALGTFEDRNILSRLLKMTSRDSFLIGPDAKVREVWRKVSPAVTMSETFEAVQKHLT